MSRNFLHYCFMKMRFSFFIYIILFVFITTSCKKGCTDPLAYNYNAHRSIDNGRCKYHNFVRIDSIRILNISDTDQNGVEWDDPFNWWDLTFDVYIGNDLIYMSDIFDVNFSMMGNDVFLTFAHESRVRYFKTIEMTERNFFGCSPVSMHSSYYIFLIVDYR